jgi:hypothetical protein
MVCRDLYTQWSSQDPLSQTPTSWSIILPIPRLISMHIISISARTASLEKPPPSAVSIYARMRPDATSPAPMIFDVARSKNSNSKWGKRYSVSYSGTRSRCLRISVARDEICIFDILSSILNQPVSPISNRQPSLTDHGRPQDSSVLWNCKRRGHVRPY